MGLKDSSSLKVFSIYQNMIKYIKGSDIDFDKLHSISWFNRSGEFIKSQCKRVYNDVENSFFNYKDFTLFLLHNFIFNKKLNWAEVNSKNINSIKELYKNEQFIIDQQFILELDKQLNFKDISAYFKINRNGGNLVYDELILKKRVSPLFYIMLEDDVDENSNFEESEELKKFKKILRKIRKII